MASTDPPRADQPVTDFDPNDPKDDAGDPAPNPGDARDNAGSGPGLTTVGGVTGGATDGMPGTGSGSPNG